MKHTLSVDKICNMGFEWPKTSAIQEFCVVENGKVNLDKSLDKIRTNCAYYKNQITAAYKFKTQTGADYSDFTDKFDDYVQMERLLGEAVTYLEKIVAAHLHETSH